MARRLNSDTFVYREQRSIATGAVTLAMLAYGGLAL
jgi:hypothetical protein